MTQRRAEPWAPGDVIATALGIGLGLLLLLVGYFGAAGKEQLDDEIAWLNVAVLGVIAAGAAELAWLLSGRRRVSRLRDRVVDVYGSALTAPLAPAAISIRPAPGDWVVLEGATWRHRADCVLAAGKDSRPARQGDTTETCSVCGESST